MKLHSMWFMLDKIKDGPISLVLRTPTEDEPFTEFSCYKMNDGHILVGINNFMRFTARYNLVAVSNGIEEIVNVQLFENIMDHYDAPINNTEHGYFVFVDSVVVDESKDWRCDKSRFGNVNYETTEGGREFLIQDGGQLILYEPILSVLGVSHIVCIRFVNDEGYRDYYANHAELPIVGATISELFKLITEWAIVSQEPFNNQQGISQDANEFLKQLNFDSSLVDYQVDMYIAEFLKGNENARQRPQNVQPLSQDLDMFIKRNMSYRCLSALISLYPNSYNLQEIINEEETTLDFVHKLLRDRFGPRTSDLAISIFENNINKSMRLHNLIKATGTF